MDLKRFNSKNFYERLGVAVDAEAPQIESAYRALAEIYDPFSEYRKRVIQKPASDEERKVYRLVNEAYHTLINPQQKAAYDASLARVRKPGPVVASDPSEEELLRVDLQEIPTRPFMSLKEKRRMRLEQMQAAGVTSTGSHFLGADPAAGRGNKRKLSGFDKFLLFCSIGLPAIAILICLIMFVRHLLM